MRVIEVLRLQPPAQPIFKTPDTETTAPTIHVRGFPYTRSDDVCFRVFANRCRDAPVGRERSFRALFARNARRGVDAAIDARPTIGSIANRFGAMACRQGKSQCLHLESPCRVSHTTAAKRAPSVCDCCGGAPCAALPDAANIKRVLPERRTRIDAGQLKTSQAGFTKLQRTTIGG